MSEEQSTFLKLIEKRLAYGVLSFIGLMLISMFWFYTSANGRLNALEKSQSEKVNQYEFENYQRYQNLKDKHINQSLTEIKSDVKDIKNSL